eukprot:542576-Rhodomonas_salina.1
MSASGALRYHPARARYQPSTLQDWCGSTHYQTSTIGPQLHHTLSFVLRMSISVSDMLQY